MNSGRSKKFREWYLFIMKKLILETVIKFNIGSNEDISFQGGKISSKARSTMIFFSRSHSYSENSILRM